MSEVWYGQTGAPVSHAIAIDTITRSLWMSQSTRGRLAIPITDGRMIRNRVLTSC